VEGREFWESYAGDWVTLMQYKLKSLLFYFIIFAVVLSGCGKPDPKSISDSLEIIYDNTSEIPLGNRISIWIKNTSNYCVEFPLKDGTKLYAQQNGTWVEVANNVEFIGSQVITLKPNDEMFSEDQLSIHPDVSNLDIRKPIKFRALLTGNLCEDKTMQIQKEIPFTLVPK
jgi:hypothetical protein